VLENLSYQCLHSTPGLCETLLQEKEELPPLSYDDEHTDGEQQTVVQTSPLVAGTEHEEWLRTQYAQRTSKNGNECSPTNDEQWISTKAGDYSPKKKEDWYPAMDDASDFAQSNHYIQSSITNEGNSPDSGDAVTDSDTAVGNQAAETTGVICKLKRKGYRAVPPHQTPQLPDGWIRHFDHVNGILYVDEGATHGEDRTFFLPPVPEKHSDSPLPGGWRRIETPSGRIHWLHKSGLVSHEHPGYSECIRIGCISHDKCMLIFGHFRNQGSEGMDGRTEFETYELSSWEHLGNNSRVLYDSFQLYDRTFVCQMTSTSWHRRPRLVSPTSIFLTGQVDDGSPPGWQKRHDYIGHIFRPSWIKHQDTC
jgi:hypothetical protein